MYNKPYVFNTSAHYTLSLMLHYNIDQHFFKVRICRVISQLRFITCIGLPVFLLLCFSFFYKYALSYAHLTCTFYIHFSLTDFTCPFHIHISLKDFNIFFIASVYFITPTDSSAITGTVPIRLSL